MFINRDRASRQSCTPARGFDLQRATGELNRVVATDRPRVLDGKKAIQVCSQTGQKRAPRLDRRNLETPIELANVVLAQETVGLLECDDPVQPQFLWQTSLPGSEATLGASTRLG
jgi:hypothetical protein